MKKFDLTTIQPQTETHQLILSEFNSYITMYDEASDDQPAHHLHITQLLDDFYDNYHTDDHAQEECGYVFEDIINFCKTFGINTDAEDDEYIINSQLYPETK